MEFIKIDKPTTGIKISAQEDGKEVGRAWLYLIYNGLHNQPYGLLEDVFVDESRRGKGIGNELLKQIIVLAKEKGCYKLLATSRKNREEIHRWYERFGFKECGLEYRMDF